MHRRTILPILLSAALVACGHDAPAELKVGEPVSNTAVSVVREGNSLRITNLTNEARAFTASDPNWLALASFSLLANCTTTDAACLRLPAHGSLLVPLAEVGGFSSSTKEIVVSTWRVLPGTGGVLQPVPDESITLTL